MNGNWTNSGGCGLARDKSGLGKRRGPRVVFGGDAAFAARLADPFYLLGWEVCAAGDSVHSAAARKNPTAVVLPVRHGDESGFLTCAKLRLARPKLRVVLVGERTPRAERLARFVGATLASEDTAADAVLKLI